MRPESASDPGRDRRASLGELTSFLIAGLEDARKRDNTVDARHIIAQLTEGLRRRACFPQNSRDGRRFDETYDFLRAVRDSRLSSAGNPHLLLDPPQDFEALAVRGGAVQPVLASSNAVASHFGPGLDKAPSGVKLDLVKSAASIDFPERGGTISLRDRRAVLTFGSSRFGLAYQFQLSSSRMIARGAAVDGGARVGVGAAACALIVAAVLLYALPRLPTMQSRQVVVAETEKKPTASKPDVRPSPPMFTIMRVPLFEEKAAAAEPPPAAVPAPGHVATRSTTNIRARPEPGAQVVRVVPGRLILKVFAHNDDWIEVGGSEAWGWVPSGLIIALAPEG